MFNDRPLRMTGLVAAVVLSALICPPSSLVASDWPMFHGDRRHSGLSPMDAPFDSLLAWSVTAADSIIYSSPVLATDGTIYIGTLAEQLLALSPSGAVQWIFDASANFRHSTPAVGDDGTIYIGGADGVLYAVNPNGTQQWTYTAGGAIKTSPNFTLDGAILFGADDGRLYAVNPDSTLRWTFPTGAEIRSSPAVGPDGTIFFGSTDSFFYALWPDGSLRWQAATGDQIKFCSPAVTETGVVYFGSYDGFVYALTTDQQFLWAYPTGHVVRSSPAIGADGRIYIGADDQLLALHPDGSLDWDYTTGGLVISSPVFFDDDSVVAVGSDDGVFYCLGEDGSLDWRYTVGSPIRSVPAPSAPGNIYVADVSGTIWAFGADEPNAIGDASPAPRAGLQLVAAPNPTSGAVTFRVLSGGRATDAIVVYDVLGREIDRLATGGRRAFLWDGRDRRGRPLPAGTYFYRAAGHQRTGRLVIIR